jgi:hypothetical protein
MANSKKPTVVDLNHSESEPEAVAGGAKPAEIDADKANATVYETSAGDCESPCASELKLESTTDLSPTLLPEAQAQPSQPPQSPQPILRRAPVSPTGKEPAPTPSVHMPVEMINRVPDSPVSDQYHIENNVPFAMLGRPFEQPVHAHIANYHDSSAVAPVEDVMTRYEALGIDITSPMHPFYQPAVRAIDK